ncbi:MAG: hypothetical protein H5T69_21455, partial [Chloroflexi bacterium]|nr:hypothetical protein [Chloroflexota bacterium]
KGHSSFAPLPSLLALLPYKNESEVFLFEYPDGKISDEPLGSLIGIEKVDERKGDLNEPYYGHLGYLLQEKVLLNLFYRDLDFFGPYALVIPSGEGMWIATISKRLKDKMRIEKRTIFPPHLLYEVVNFPIWEYRIGWYLGGNLLRETTIEKASQTSFIWFAYPRLKTSGELALYLFEGD